MEELISCSWIIVVLFGIIISLKGIIPEWSYAIRSSLIIAISGVVIFSTKFINIIDSDLNFWLLIITAIWPLLFCIICCYYIYKGGKTVAFKTTTGVFSKIYGTPVGIMNAGSLNWADPLFEKTTISTDGIPNKSADLQELKVKISETPLIQTKTRGIQAQVKNITFMLKLSGNIKEILRIEGGATTIRERIIEFVEEFFLEEITKILPEQLDQDKMKVIHELTTGLKKAINGDDGPGYYGVERKRGFCERNKYPYKITGEVIIGDTELETKYYEVLAKKEFSRLEQDARDVEAARLRERIADFGRHIRPNASEKEQTENALIALGIVKKDIQEKKYGIDSDLSELAKDIVRYLKG